MKVGKLMLASAALTVALSVTPAFASTYGLPRSWFTSPTPMHSTHFGPWGYVDYTWNEKGTQQLRNTMGIASSAGSLITVLKRIGIVGIASGVLGVLSNTIGRRDNGYGVTIRCVNGFPVWVYPNTP
jgi:hypothetical protein